MGAIELQLQNILVDQHEYIYFARIRVQQVQVPPEGRHSRQDLLPSGENQDQAHGDCHYKKGNDRIGTQYFPRKRGDSKVGFPIFFM